MARVQRIDAFRRIVLAINGYHCTINLLSAVFVGKGDGYGDIIWQLFFANCTIKGPAIVTKLSA